MSWHACLVKPMSWHAFWQCLGMLSRVVACLVKPKSWHALSCPCRDMPLRANVETCRANVVSCLVAMSWHVKPCGCTMSWYFKPCGCMPCHASSGCPVTSTSRAMPWPLQPHLFFYASFKNPLSWPLHFMFLAMHVDEDMLSRVKMPCPAHIVAFLVPVSWHALFPCHGMPCQGHAKHRGFRYPWHGMPCQAHVMPCLVMFPTGCPVTSTSRAIPCLA
jgi:hypothetical protein